MTATTKQSKGKQKEKISEQIPSTNWLALQKACPSRTRSTSRQKKRRKVDDASGDGISEAGSSNLGTTTITSFRPRDSQSPHLTTSLDANLPSVKHGRESLDYLRKVVLGQLEYSEEQRQPGKYLALDCEMVGVGPEGVESSLARVSLVNYHGAVILDEFVRQRERVVDYRTFASGIRPQDMVKAIRFSDVQKRVSELLKCRILVGHALHNDLKALLLSQPRNLTRDTQLCAGKARLLKTKYPALRKLAEKELGVTIQAGEHSSVTDARAAMAIYRLHRKEWDKNFRNVPNMITSSKILGKREASVDLDEGDEGTREQCVTRATVKQSRQEKIDTGRGKRGVSTGLSTIVKRGAETWKTGKLAPELRKEGLVVDVG